MEALEEMLLARSREACIDALAGVQYVEDYLVSSMLQAAFLSRVGRIDEAYDLASSKSFQRRCQALSVVLSHLSA